MIRRAGLLALILVAVSLTGDTASAYLKLGATAAGSTVSLNWQNMPVRYFVSNRSGGGVTAAQLEQAVVRAFGTWDAVPSAELSTQFVGVTTAAPALHDGMNTIGFVDRADQDRVLGSTNFLVDTVTGDLVESDIFLNSTFSWSVAGAGEAGRFDVESIALHEVGHLLGLGHSALGETEVRPGGRRVLAAEAAMFPIAFSSGSIEGRTLREDDIAGISDIYPGEIYREERGSISGRVTKAGQAVIGAHVIAFNTHTGKLVGGFALNSNGGYVIGGLQQGTYAIRVEPLDDGDIESFFDPTLNVDTNFRVKFHDRLVVVPRGGGISNVNVAVVAK
jgi:hypothetical protein